jgi:hypothetical protein
MVSEVAKALRISEGEVYRRAKGDLKSATVTLEPGTLRFDPQKILRRALRCLENCGVEWEFGPQKRRPGGARS